MGRVGSKCLPVVGVLAFACTDANLYGSAGRDPPLADKLALAGVLCTDDPATRQFPVKILFIVDSSGQMRNVAPFNEHVRAIEQTLSQYLPIANVSLGIVRYDNDATQLISEPIGRTMSGFTRDEARIDAALQNLSIGAGARDLRAAMSLVRSIITGDVHSSERGPLSRTKYVVVHIVSGSPDPAIIPDRCLDYVPPPADCEPAYFERQVRDLRADVLELGAAEFVFHVVHLEQPHVEGTPCDPRQGAGACTGALVCVRAGARTDTGRCVEPCDPAAASCGPGRACVYARLIDDTVIDFCARGELDCFDGEDNDRDGNDRDCADPTYPYVCTGGRNCEYDCRSSCRTERLGTAMALATGGRYERFPYVDRVTFGRIDFRSSQRLFVLKEFLAVNRNAIPTIAGFVPDSDADGMADTEEQALGTSPMNADTDGDFFGDKLEHIQRVLGMDPLAPNPVPEDCPDPTIDGDGDGLRDCEEKLLGFDATLFDTDADGFPDNVEFRMGTNGASNDSLDDIDLDGVNNGVELHAHTDPTTNDARTRAELAYRYRTIDLGATNDERSCYDVRVSNIGLVDTLDRGSGPGFNDVDVYFGQVPDGDLEGFGVFHATQVRVQYLPPDKRIPDAQVLDLEEDDFVAFEQ